MTRWQEKSELSHLPYKPCLSRSLSFLGFFHQPLSPSFGGGGGGGEGGGNENLKAHFHP